jgi:putative nucleotidyltransferase with HDIG domain
MNEKRILIADVNPQVLEDFRFSLGRQWEVTAVNSVAAGLEEMKKQTFDALVAELDLPETGGAELLNQARRRNPNAVRFILAGAADRERVLKNVMGAHQVITKPFDRSTLQNTVERALALDKWIENDNMRKLVTRIRTFPAIPSLYFEVLNVLRSPAATTDAVGEVISKDMAMTTGLLQVINSAYFGLSRKITDPAEAVGLLGFETTKSLILSIKVLNQQQKQTPGQFSIDRLWQHSLEVARIAKELVWLETNDRALADAAFAGGLLHDLGKVVLAMNFNDQYRGAHSLARKQRVPLGDVEKEIFGATHGEIGAYLLGLWGMPLDLLEIAALHHEPSRTTTPGFTALTAVHVANAFAHEANPEPEEGWVPPQLDKAYLASLGVLERLEARKAVVTGTAVSASELQAQPTPAPVPVKPAAPRPAPQRQPAARPQPKQPQAEPEFAQKPRWVLAGVGAAALVLAIFVLPRLRHSEPALPVQARAESAPQTASEQRSAAPAASQTPVAPNPAPESPKSTEPAAAVTQSQSPASPDTAPDTADHPAPPVKPPPPAPGEFRLRGIFYSAANPAAIVNGEMVHKGDTVSGGRVVDIRPSLVIVEYQNQRKNLILDPDAARHK